MVIGTSAIVFAAAAAVGVIFAFAIARRMRRHAAGKAVRAICGMGGSGGHCAHGRPWRPEAYPVKTRSGQADRRRRSYLWVSAYWG
jgi:hypothetical protein